MPIQILLRITYWTLWFVIVPAVLAAASVWLLSPSELTESIGPLRLVANIIQSQPVPVAVLLFTLFEMILWSKRHVLPLAGAIGVGGRRDLPVHVRKQFDQAQGLLEEAARLQGRHHKKIRRQVAERLREKLDADLSALRESMEREPFDTEAFESALKQAQSSVDTCLSRWRKSELRELAEAILVAVSVALLLRAFVIEAFKIPSLSMVPTLAVGDHIFVNKMVYGPMLPFTQTRLFEQMPPDRGDVIVFQYPENTNEDYIKRTIGHPGDRIEAIDGRPRINGWLAPRCHVGRFSYFDDMDRERHEGDLYVEYLGSHSYLTFVDRTKLPNDTALACKQDLDCPEGQGCADAACGVLQGPYVVKPGQVFMMGDNRLNSYDSRLWYEGRGGGVPFDYIRGRALWIWMSLASTGEVAWNRIGLNVMGTPRLSNEYHDRHHKRVAECMSKHPGLAAATPPQP